MAESPPTDPATVTMNPPEGNSSTKTISRKHEKVNGSVHQSSPKNGILSKRIVPATDKKTNATPPTASRATASSTARNTPNGSLSRASSRHLSSTDGRHSQAAPASSKPSSIRRKHGNSVSSTEGFTKLSLDASSAEGEDAENKPPSPSERAGSISPVKSIIKPSSRPSSLASSTAAGKTTRSTLAHLSKAMSTRGADEGRARPGTNTVRNGRTRPSPAEAKATTNGSIRKKTIIDAASPATSALRSEINGVSSNRPPSPPKKVRPGLGTRKSTMSVTIEQRLREISLVHQMLHAAMAEEGDEDDEVKEAYGKQMDDTLAALKSKLEDAKREEALVEAGSESQVEISTNGNPDHALAIIEGPAVPSDDHQFRNDTFQAGAVDEKALEEREKVLLEQLEGVDVSSTDDISPRELKVAKLELLKVRSDLESLQASSEEEVGGLRETIETLTNRLHSIQASHQSKERETNSLARANEHLQEKLRLLESDTDGNVGHHGDSAEELRNDQGQLVEAKNEEIHSSQETIKALKAEIDELQASKQREEQYSRQVVKALQDRIESSERELSQHRAAAADLETRILQCEKSVNEHEGTADALRYELDEVQASKDREMTHYQEAIEALQDRIRQLSETKERELQAIKQLLAQEHEEAVAELRVEFDDALAKKEEDVKQQATSKDAGDSLVEELRDTYQSQLEQLRATLGSVHASNTELRHELDDNKKHYEEALSKLKRELEHSTAEISRLHAEIETARQQFLDIGKEKDVAQSTIESNAEVLKQLTDGVSSLQQQLTASKDEELALLERNARNEKELAATETLLDEQRNENQRLVANHKSELESTRSLRADLERQYMEMQDAHDHLQLEHVILLSQIDSLRSDLAEASAKGKVAVDQRLAELGSELEAAKEAKTELNNQLQNAKADLEKATIEVDKHKTRRRELESALKVTTAELMELRTERPNGSSYSGSPVPKAGLRSSRWAKEDHGVNGHRDGSVAGEESDSHIEGQV
ncbi:MAG: hypothetical protein L6R39_001432 [Caloplaca ligustica]|nr:MAG: hypothetical protein L6R39_001432 [Caloplaca ligustica]